jgi:hypothetical protein
MGAGRATRYNRRMKIFPYDVIEKDAKVTRLYAEPFLMMTDDPDLMEPVIGVRVFFEDEPDLTLIFDAGQAESAFAVISKQAQNIKVALQLFNRDTKIAARKLERLREKRAHTISPCTVGGCKRPMHFTDDEGRGFCKRHADEAGVRPTGKVI